MILLDYILLGIIVMGLGLIVVIIVKKFPMLSSINTKSMPEQTQKMKKQEMLEQRLTRKFEDQFDKIIKVTKPTINLIRESFRRTYHKINEIERQYSIKVKQAQNSDDSSGLVKGKVELLLQEAQDLQKENKYKDAEKKYIEIVSLDKNNLKAFAMLGELYMEMKEYDFAHETFSHLLKIDPQNALVYHDLGLLAKLRENDALAIKNYAKALEIEPNNPKILDSLLELSLEIGNKVLAWETFDKFKETNPE
ncbi:tetratricopeptide repeat protein, partial [Patescibacteria group bacterium]|nr:tetratricopeptide repeat protein [Patescibacteria group bacterium]